MMPIQQLREYPVENDHDEHDEFKELVTKEEIIRELERFDKKIMELHNNRYRVKRKFIATPQSELFRLKRSFLFAKLCELDDDEW